MLVEQLIKEDSLSNSESLSNTAGYHLRKDGITELT